jgi:hypothetical protein
VAKWRLATAVRLEEGIRLFPGTSCSATKCRLLFFFLRSQSALTGGRASATGAALFLAMDPVFNLVSKPFAAEDSIALARVWTLNAILCWRYDLKQLCFVLIAFAGGDVDDLPGDSGHLGALPLFSLPCNGPNADRFRLESQLLGTL